MVSRRARPFAASGAPCLTFNLPAPLCLLRPRQRRTDRLHPQISRQHRLGKCVVGEPEQPGRCGATGMLLPPRDREGRAPPLHIVSLLEPIQPEPETWEPDTHCKTPGGRAAPNPPGWSRPRPPASLSLLHLIPVDAKIFLTVRTLLLAGGYLKGPPALPFHWPALASRPPEAAVARGR